MGVFFLILNIFQLILKLDSEWDYYSQYMYNEILLLESNYYNHNAFKKSIYSTSCHVDIGSLHHKMEFLLWTSNELLTEVRFCFRRGSPTAAIDRSKHS